MSEYTSQQLKELNEVLNKVEWTTTYFTDLNQRLTALGRPTFVLANGKVYLDAMHLYLDIGVKLDQPQEVYKQLFNKKMEDVKNESED